MPSIVCRDCAHKTPSGPEEAQQGPGVLALITGLCRFYGVPVPPNKVIMPHINRAFIKKYCAPRQVQGEAPRQPGDGQQLAADAPPPPLESTSAHLQRLEHCLRYMADQQAPNHRDRYEQVLGL